jgi:hypothetical protein
MAKIPPDFGKKLSGSLERAGAAGRAAGRKLDKVRHGTAGALVTSACSLREAGEAIDNLAEAAAAKLDSTAAYVRRHDLRDMLKDFRPVIRRHPAAFAMGAAAGGIVLAFAMRRRWRA